MKIEELGKQDYYMYRQVQHINMKEFNTGQWVVIMLVLIIGYLVYIKNSLGIIIYSIIATIILTINIYYLLRDTKRLNNTFNIHK